jgi:hypothetical protein
LLRDTTTLRQEEPGIELATFHFHVSLPPEVVPPSKEQERVHQECLGFMSENITEL